MLQFFRSNQLFASLLLIFYGFLLHLPAWWQAPEVLSGLDNHAGVLGSWANDTLKGNRWVSISLPVVLLFVMAVFANRLAFRERLSRKVTQFPGLFIILVGSIVPATFGLHSLQFANLFLLLSIIAIFRLYRSTDVARQSFNAGFWLGMATLCNANYAWFFALLLVAAGTLNTMSLRMLLRILTGVLVPLLLTGTWFFWNGQFSTFLEVQSIGFMLPTFAPEPLWNLGGIVLLSGILGFVLFKQNNNTKLLNIEGRKKINILYWWLLLSLLILPVFGPVDATVIQLIVVPLGFILSLSFSRGGQSAGEAGHLFLLVLLFGFQLLPMLGS